MSAPQKTRTRRVSRDTGFPEPFDQFSNTTLPHPDADLSPNACITHDEKAGEMLMTRRKRMPTGLLSRSKSKLASAHDIIHHHNNNNNNNNNNNSYPESKSDTVFSSILSRSSDKESGPHLPPQLPLTRTSSATGSSEDGNESVSAAREDDMSPPTSPDSVRSLSKRNSLLRKFKR